MAEVEDDVPISTDWCGGGFCFNISLFICKVCRLTLDAYSSVIHRAICIAASGLFQGATKSGQHNIQIIFCIEDLY